MTFPGGLQLGGGVTPANAGAWLDAGASHVIVTSYLFVDGVLDECRLAEMARGRRVPWGGVGLGGGAG